MIPGPRPDGNSAVFADKDSHAAGVLLSGTEVEDGVQETGKAMIAKRSLLKRQKTCAYLALLPAGPLTPPREAVIACLRAYHGVGSGILIQCDCHLA